ncbi:acyl-CoA-like ligand-binding transcription factor [Millisia brevis]|uniref:acyl-CoA-like ligand-binding transcription factor n=1 Tax=Millisia brevis TaxID=264148 RepID=UPI00082AE3D2|nr:TetR family transcriptional regulator [Millisia brevis]
MAEPSESAQQVDADVVAIDRGGRPATTSAHELAAHAQRLFVANGFDNTSVEDIAAAAGVSRRTFFRYFPTKADVVWVESDAEFEVFRELLERSERGIPPAETVTAAFIAALDHGRDQDEWARHRAELIMSVPAVQARANLVYRQWRAEMRRFVADRLGMAQDDRYPVAVAHAVTAASVAAHEHWLSRSDLTMRDCLRGMFDLMVPPYTP